MTLPDERYRAVVQTQKFLIEILSTPRVPKAIKDQARSCLRHYPSEWDMKAASELASHVFQERMEDVTRMIKVYERSKAEKNET
jgi:hypothetical protein